MDKLSLALWRERELLEELHYRLEVEQMVLASGREHWLARAAGDVQETLEALRTTGVLRAAVADEAAESCGLPPDPSLRALAEVADEPWRGILLEHRTALVTLAREIAALAEVNRALITTGFQAAKEVLAALGAADSYAADGSAVSSAPAARLIDRSL